MGAGASVARPIKKKKKPKFKAPSIFQPVCTKIKIVKVVHPVAWGDSVECLIAALESAQSLPGQRKHARCRCYVGQCPLALYLYDPLRGHQRCPITFAQSHSRRHAQCARYSAYRASLHAHQLMSKRCCPVISALPVILASW